MTSTLNPAICEIFDNAQKAVAHHRQGVQKLSKLFDSTEQMKDNFDSLFICYDQILQYGKKEPVAERVAKFFASFVGQANETILGMCIAYLVQRSTVTDKTVRFRSCQTISMILSSMDSDAEISDNVWNVLIDAVMPRFKDKCAVTRTWAVKCATRLQDPTDPEDAIVNEMLTLLTSDPSKDVRIACLQSLCICKHTLPAILSRLRDVRVEVRVATVQLLYKSIDIRHLSASMRNAVIMHGLNDRDNSVKSQTVKLVFKWLQNVDNNIPRLLQLFNVHEYEETTTVVGKCLLSEILISVPSLRSALQEPIDWENPSMHPTELLWTLIRCEYYKSHMSEAAYGDLSDALLCDAVDMCSLLTKLSDDALAELNMKYLLKLLNFVDVSDISTCRQIHAACMEQISFASTSVLPLLLSTLCKMTAQLGQNATAGCMQLVRDMFANENTKIRALEIAAYCLETSTDTASELIPLVMECIQQPILELRYMAVKCLGLLCLQSETPEFKDILYQVVCATEECVPIREIAFMAYVDMLLKFDSLDVNSNVLFRMLESAEATLTHLAIEAVCKLFFLGRITDPRLFAQLLKLYQSTPSTEEGSARAPQLLSLFLVSFIEMHECDDIILNSLNYAVNDIASMIRQGDTESSVYKLVAQLVTVCESQKKVELCAAIQYRLSAILYKEILSCGKRKSDKMVLKELIKTLASLSIDVTDNAKCILVHVVGQMLLSCDVLDRTNQKTIEKFLETLHSEASVDCDSGDARLEYMSFAPGLMDLLQVHNDNDSESGSEDDEVESDFENEARVAPPVSNRAGRACKSQAQNRIAAQLATEDGPKSKRSSNAKTKLIEPENDIIDGGEIEEL